MVSLSNVATQVQDSPTQGAAARARELKAQGKDIISLTVGEPDFDTPEYVKQGVIDAMDQGFSKYTATPGIMPLRESIADKLKRHQNIQVSPSQVLVTCGGKQALTETCLAVLNPGDEAIIPAPYWTSYPEMVRSVGATPVFVQTTPENGYVLTPEQLEEVWTEKSKMLFLNSPSNPTGACYSPEELRALADAFKSLPGSEKAVILSDEVYEYMIYDGVAHVSILNVAPELAEQTVIVNSFSKAYSLTGWRVGYAVGPQNLISSMSALQSHASGNVCSIAQYGALRAYEDDGAFPRQMLEHFSVRRDIITEALQQMPGVALEPAKPSGAFFAYMRIGELFGRKIGGEEITCSLDVVRYLLEEYDVATVQGDAFGDDGAIRLSFALDTELLQTALSRIDDALKRLLS